MLFDEKLSIQKTNTEKYKFKKWIEADKIIRELPKSSLIVHKEKDHLAQKYMVPRKYRLSFIKTSAAVLACYTLRLDEWVLYFFLYAKYWLHIHGYLFGF